jgi:hypothetical protein
MGLRIKAKVEDVRVDPDHSVGPGVIIGRTEVVELLKETAIQVGNCSLSVPFSHLNILAKIDPECSCSEFVKSILSLWKFNERTGSDQMLLRIIFVG